MTELPDMRARYEEALVEVEEMKRTLRERAKRVADLEQRLMRQQEHGGRLPAVDLESSDLARAVAAADAEKALAQAEREKLDERERSIRKVERELAQLRVQLEEERASLGGAGTLPTPLPQTSGEPDLEPAAARRRTRRR